MNFKEAYKKGQQGSNKGLPFGKALKVIQKWTNGLIKSMIYAVAAAPKGGKSTFVDIAFVIEPCVYVLDNNLKYDSYIEQGLSDEQIKTLHNIRRIDFDIIYNSYEIDRISKEFDFATHFLNRDFGIESIELDEGVTYNGQKVITLTSDYLRGRLTDDNDKIITVKETVYEALKIVYETRIVPLFGEYSTEGSLLKKGIITFLEQKENPTGVRNYLINYAKLNGTILYSPEFTDNEGKKHKRMIGYKPFKEDKQVLVITDHLRKLIPERGFTLKQTVDKFSEYSVELKNLFGFSFVHIIHLNRSMTDVSRMKHQEDMLYPNSDDVKETGNLAEDCDYMFTLFNPNDDRYGLTKHFGTTIKDRSNNLLYPNMRTIHLVESRHTFYPQHTAVNMIGSLKKFEPLKQ